MTCTALPTATDTATHPRCCSIFSDDTQKDTERIYIRKAIANDGGEEALLSVFASATRHQDHFESSSLVLVVLAISQIAWELATGSVTVLFSVSLPTAARVNLHKTAHPLCSLCLCRSLELSVYKQKLNYSLWLFSFANCRLTTRILKRISLFSVLFFTLFNSFFHLVLSEFSQLTLVLSFSHALFFHLSLCSFLVSFIACWAPPAVSFPTSAFLTTASNDC